MDDTDITALLSRDLTAYQVAQAAFEEARQTLLVTLTAFVGTTRPSGRGGWPGCRPRPWRCSVSPSRPPCWLRWPRTHNPGPMRNDGIVKFMKNRSQTPSP